MKLVDHGYIHERTFVHLNDTENWIAYENSYIYPLIKGSIKAKKTDTNMQDENSISGSSETRGTYDDDHSIPTDESSVERPSGEEKALQINEVMKVFNDKKDYRRKA